MPSNNARIYADYRMGRLLMEKQPTTWLWHQVVNAYYYSKSLLDIQGRYYVQVENKMLLVVQIKRDLTPFLTILEYFSGKKV